MSRRCGKRSKIDLFVFFRGIISVSSSDRCCGVNRQRQKRTIWNEGSGRICTVRTVGQNSLQDMSLLLEAEVVVMDYR